MLSTSNETPSNMLCVPCVDHQPFCVSCAEILELLNDLRMRVIYLSDDGRVLQLTTSYSSTNW